MENERFVIALPRQAFVAVKGGGRFPVRRIFCIGKNYADHVKEMGGDPKLNPPVFFTKPADAVVGSGSTIPYAQATEHLHYEGELVVALKEGGRNISSPEAASRLVFGYAAGCDLTRRDLQAAAKSAGAPWDTAKAFDDSAPIGEIVPADRFLESQIEGGRISLLVNGTERQSSDLAAMIWPVPEVILALSRLFELQPGDLIFTGTPEGVGPLNPGDKVEVRVSGVPPLTFSIGPANGS
jgi:fumarylpyruvate hydrolase